MEQKLTQEAVSVCTIYQLDHHTMEGGTAGDEKYIRNFSRNAQCYRLLWSPSVVGINKSQCNEVFSGDQPCENGGNIQRFRDYLSI